MENLILCSSDVIYLLNIIETITYNDCITMLLILYTFCFSFIYHTFRNYNSTLIMGIIKFNDFFDDYEFVLDKENFKILKKIFPNYINTNSKLISFLIFVLYIFGLFFILTNLIYFGKYTIIGSLEFILLFIFIIAIIILDFYKFSETFDFMFIIICVLCNFMISLNIFTILSEYIYIEDYNTFQESYY